MGSFEYLINNRLTELILLESVIFLIIGFFRHEHIMIQTRQVLGVLWYEFKSKIALLSRPYNIFRKRKLLSKQSYSAASTSLSTGQRLTSTTLKLLFSTRKTILPKTYSLYYNSAVLCTYSSMTVNPPLRVFFQRHLEPKRTDRAKVSSSLKFVCQKKDREVWSVLRVTSLGSVCRWRSTRVVCYSMWFGVC